MSEWWIHYCVCPICGSDSYIDRPHGCWNCGAEMEIEKRRVAQIEVGQ